MTLTELSNFIRIVELQSLSKAAAVIRIAQPALSRQIRNLEADLGALLLVRHSWGVTPTEAGEALLIHARRVIREAEEARGAVHALAVEPSGRVSVGVPSSLATVLLPRLAVVLKEKYPSLRPYFVDGLSARLHTEAVAGDLDLAVLYSGRSNGSLSATPLLTENLVLVGPADADVRQLPRTVDMVAEKPLVLPARPNRLRIIADELLASGEQMANPLIYEVDSFPAIMAMVEHGVGYTLLPYCTVAASVAYGRLSVWELHFPLLSRMLVLCRPLNRSPTKAVAVVEKEIHALVADMADEMRWRSLAGNHEK